MFRFMHLCHVYLCVIHRAYMGAYRFRFTRFINGMRHFVYILNITIFALFYSGLFRFISEVGSPTKDELYVFTADFYICL